MRHNQNARHVRGRRSNGHGGNHHHGNSGGGGGGGGQQRRVNPRVQTFDSNGPDVRIRGNAFQITEKYLTLARDAASAGDRILAESYLQHAEHYQRMINEMNDEYARQNPGYNPHQQQQSFDGSGPQPSIDAVPVNQPQAQPSAEGMSDLDQGFLVGPRGNGAAGSASESGNQSEQSQDARTHHRNFARQKETEAI
jgi:hypothetical protein